MSVLPSGVRETNTANQPRPSRRTRLDIPMSPGREREGVTKHLSGIGGVSRRCLLGWALSSPFTGLAVPPCWRQQVGGHIVGPEPSVPLSIITGNVALTREEVRVGIRLFSRKMNLATACRLALMACLRASWVTDSDHGRAVVEGGDYSRHAVLSGVQFAAMIALLCCFVAY